MELIRKKDLMFGHRGFLARTLAGMLMGLLGINNVNRLYTATRNSGEKCAEDLLSILNTTYSVCDEDIANIPLAGGVMIISNHPTGGLDGVMLIDLLSKLRPDIKFMGNFLLNRIDSLSQYFISVDPFNDHDPRRNLQGIKESIEHVRAGGALMVFPAGEVSSLQKGFGSIKDKKWGRSMLRFIRELNVPVVPISIEARNSKKFYILGKIHPLVRTAMIPREFTNKRNLIIPINIGSPVLPAKTAGLPDFQTYGDYLRANVEYLHRKQRLKPIRIVKRRVPLREVEEIARPADRQALAGEITALNSSSLLFSQSGFDVYLAGPEAIPTALKEIGRLRELSFRAVGEGTMKAVDTDKYDSYYRHLFLWDRTALEIAGAYRLGMGDEILRRYGLRGFYVDSLFRLSDRMLPVMEKTIELGRSFVAPGYQRQSTPLLLLWKGILQVLLRNGQYRTFMGPVSISGEFDRVSKTIMVRHLQQHYFDEELARFIKPVEGIKSAMAPIDASLIRNIVSIDMIDKLVRDIERGELSVPVLVKKYLQLNGSVLGFNVDRDFADALDVLMLVDIGKIPQQTVDMLSKDFPGAGR